MTRKKVEKLEAKRTHLQNWLERNKEAQRIVHFVQGNLELTEWEINTIDNLPDNIQGGNIGDVNT